MFTLQQVNILVDSVKITFILGFIFFLVRLCMSHSLVMKGILSDDKSAAYNALKKRLTVNLSLLCLALFAFLMISNSVNNWNDYNNQANALITSDPRMMNEAMNQVFDLLKVSVILSCIYIGIRMIFKYREQTAKLKYDGMQND